jgi:hypothetical protein
LVRFTFRIKIYTQILDTLTVNETAVEAPPLDPSAVNNAKDLASEALYINQQFRRQVSEFSPILI